MPIKSSGPYSTIFLRESPLIARAGQLTWRNELFRDVAVRNYRSGDLIWVHDYQLMLLPRLLRQALPEARIVSFCIFLPSSEVFRIVPERAELMKGLLRCGPSCVSDVLARATLSDCSYRRSPARRYEANSESVASASTSETQEGPHLATLPAVGPAPELCETPQKTEMECAKRSQCGHQAKPL